MNKPANSGPAAFRNSVPGTCPAPAVAARETNCSRSQVPPASGDGGKPCSHACCLPSRAEPRGLWWFAWLSRERDLVMGQDASIEGSSEHSPAHLRTNLLAPRSSERSINALSLATCSSTVKRESADAMGIGRCKGRCAGRVPRGQRPHWSSGEAAPPRDSSAPGAIVSRSPPVSLLWSRRQPSAR